MALPIDELTIAWEALSDSNDMGLGWKCIPITAVGPCSVLAARKFPGNEVAILIQFRIDTSQFPKLLPEGVGFEVTREDPFGAGESWLGLTSRHIDNFSMFSDIVFDILDVINSLAVQSEDNILRNLISRIRSWQEFMRINSIGLSSVSELGLVGELHFMDCLLKAGLPPSYVVNAWVGPEDGLQDYDIGIGAVEIKSTLSDSSFIVRIASLSQLDESIKSPLFLAGIRFLQNESGMTLAELIKYIINQLSTSPQSIEEFKSKLLFLGVDLSRKGEFETRYLCDEIRIFQVINSFPHLTKQNVPDAVTDSKYSLDLNKVSVESLNIGVVLERLGVV